MSGKDKLRQRKLPRGKSIKPLMSISNDPEDLSLTRTQTQHNEEVSVNVKSSILSNVGSQFKKISESFPSFFMFLGAIWPKWTTNGENKCPVTFSAEQDEIKKSLPPRDSSVVLIPKNLRMSQKNQTIEAISFRLFMETARLGTLVLYSTCDVKFYTSPNLKIIVPTNPCCHFSPNSIIIINGAQVAPQRGIPALETLIRDYCFTIIMLQYHDDKTLSGIPRSKLEDQLNLIEKIMKNQNLAKARERFRARHLVPPEDIRWSIGEGKYTKGFTWNASIFNIREPPNCPYGVREVSLVCARCQINQADITFGQTEEGTDISKLGDLEALEILIKKHQKEFSIFSTL